MSVNQLRDLAGRQPAPVLLSVLMLILHRQTLGESGKTLGEVALGREILGMVSSTQLDVGVIDVAVVAVSLVVLFKEFVCDFEVYEVFPKGRDEVLTRALRQIFEDILLNLDELVALGLQVDDDVAPVGPDLVAKPDEERGLTRPLAADDEVDFTSPLMARSNWSILR